MKKIIYIFSIFAIGQMLTAQTNGIGINKKDNLRSEVDVNGEVSIEDAPNSAKILPLLYINTDEKSRKIGILPENAKPFTILRIKLKPKDGSDWVNDFDTQIPVDKYQLILSDAYFTNDKYEEEQEKGTWPNPIMYGISHTYQNGQLNKAERLYNVEQNIKLKIKDGVVVHENQPIKQTWHIFADFYGAQPYCRNHNDPYATDRSFDCNGYYWQMTFLVIRKNYVANLNNYVSESATNDKNVDILSTLLSKGEADVHNTIQ